VARSSRRRSRRRLCAAAGKGTAGCTAGSRLVEAGALPEKPCWRRTRLAEAQDEAVSSATLYGSVALEELTEEQTQQMQAAAERLVDRKKRNWMPRRSRLPKGTGCFHAGAYRRNSPDGKLRWRRPNAELSFRELIEIVRAEEELAKKPRRIAEDARELAAAL